MFGFYVRCLGVENSSESQAPVDKSSSKALRETPVYVICGLELRAPGSWKSQQRAFWDRRG